MKFPFLAAAALAAFSWAIPASATPIAPVGTTDVTVDGGLLGILASNSISAMPIEGASQTGATFSFDITGGDLGALLIEHSGGVFFDDGTNTLSATNFLINGGTGIVSANVNGGTDFVPLFILSAVDLSGPITANLEINAILSEALVNTFLSGTGTPTNALEGAVFGSASTSPAPVPLPASALLLAAGVGGLTVMRRRKAAA